MRLLILLFITIISCITLPPTYSVSLGKATKKKTKLIRSDSISVKRIYVYKIYKQVNTPKLGSNNVNETDIKRLNEPLKALAAFYSAMNGTLCNGTNCMLTTSLGLGKQGSDKHKSLINKYFPNDKVAQTVLKQDCYQRPSGASSFSEYQYITITTYGDTVRVDYKVLYFDHGIEVFNEGPDLYTLKGNKFKMLKRNLWKHIK